MDWRYWREHFEKQAERPLPLIAGGHFPAGWKTALCRSLAIFQVGESGEGRIAQEIDRCSLTAVDPDYRACLKLFVKEEHRHGAILGRIVGQLGGHPLKSTWTDTLFRQTRRLMGIRLKLMVLLIAEVVGIAYYGALASCLPPGSVRFALADICRDEEFHLRFHIAFFRTQLTSLPRILIFAAVWHLVSTAAMLVVLWDHRRTLRVMGIPQRDMMFAFHRLLRFAYHGCINTRLRDEFFVYPLCVTHRIPLFEEMRS